MSLAYRNAVDSAGVDLGDVDRFATALSRTGPALLDRVFTAEERATVRDVIALTAVFSAKESVVKALGGMPPGGRYADLHVGPVSTGEPRPVRLAGALARVAAEREISLVAGRGDAATHGVVLTWALAVPVGPVAAPARPASTQVSTAVHVGVDS